MINNYDSVVTCDFTETPHSQKQGDTSYAATKRTWLSFITLFVALFSFVFVQGQTTLISPTGDGGFENGSTFTANGWSVSNSTNNPWFVGAAVTGASPIANNSAYITNDAGVTNAYTPANNATNYFWRDITVPAGESVISLSMNYRLQGEASWDIFQVLTAPTTLTPVGEAAHPGSGSTLPTSLSGATVVGAGTLSTGVQTLSFNLPASLAGTTFRLIFLWKNETSGTQPPAAIDNISLTSRAPGVFISVATGNWNTASTWDANAVPTASDTVIVSTGHTVTADIATASAADLTVNGTLAYATACTNVSVVGNLIVGSAGLINVFATTTGKTLTVSGNITNDGRIDISVGSTSAGTLTLNGSTVQTVSGSGIFGGTVASTTTTNTVGVIRNLIINNTNTAIPNIIWSFDNIKVAYNLALTNAKINLGTNKLIFGNFAAGGTLTAASPNGILPGGKFSRWWTATATGTSFTAGTDPSNTTSRYPFINPSGLNRAMYITRTNATGAVAGELAVVYADASTNTTGLSVADGAYTVTDRYDGNWTVTNEGTAVSASSYLVALIAPNTLYPSNGNARVMGASAAISGTHQNGTATPGAQRIGVSQTDLLAGPLYVGVSVADIPFVSIANGDWNATTTWNKGTLPTCADNVTIAAGHNVTVNSVANESKGVTIVAGGTLTVASGDLKVGCTNNNNTLVNNGTLTVTGGALNINGNLNSATGSTFNQSGGDINIDGNNAGDATTSVASGTSIVQLSTNLLNLTGGTLTIVDPHANSTASNTFAYTNSVAHVNIAANHTLAFGNGVSTDAGGNTTNGFRINTYASSKRITFGNLIINTLAGTNRFVSTTYDFGVNGDLTINANSEFRDTSKIVYTAGNVVNNGVYLSTSTLYLGTYLSGTAAANTNAQTISGTGVFKNLATAETANLTSLTVNNTNATGVTLNVPLSISGTLNMTSGIINTTNTNILTLGTAAAAGTLSGAQSATNMVKGPFARTIASANANTNYILFPVGKTAYAPISIAPATTAVTVMKAEAFDSNTGTQNAAIIDLSTSRRWEAPIVSGTVTDLNIRLGDAGILATSIPVQAPSASGEYTNTFGSVATAVAGATTQSNTAVTSANYTGFLSYSNSNACSGTPAPGNTIASTNSICLGTSVNLSLQNTTSGTGVTYQWKSSTDGTTYTAITGATNPILTVTPTASTYYLCEVTCSAGPSTVTSTAVQITFLNSITATTPGTRCGVGTVALGATPSTGATVKWYAAETGGTVLGSGTTFTTPTIAATTTYYAAAESLSSGNITVGTSTTLTSSSTQNSVFCNYWYQGWRQFVYTAEELQALGLGAGNITTLSFNISSLPSPATVNNFAISLGSTNNTTLTAYQTTGLSVAYGPSNYTPTVGLNTITLSTPYAWDGVSNILIDIREDGQYASANAKTYVSTTATNTVLHSYSSTNNPAFYTSAQSPTATKTRPNVVFAGQVACQSGRTAVVATVTTPPALSVNATTATICEGSATSTVTLTSTLADYNTYAWAPATGVSGNEITGWVFNPSVSTNYTLTASQSSGDLCSSIATYAVTVNPRPSVTTIAPISAAICPDVIQSLEVSGGTLSSIATVGTATTTNSTTGYPSPFSNYYGGTKHQMLIKASELTSMGLIANQPLISLEFDVTAVGSSFSGTLNNFQIDLGLTTTNSLTTTFLPTTVNARAAANLSVAVGVVTIPLTGNFVWDGTSNIVVQTSYSNANSGTFNDYVQMKNSDPGFSSTNWYRSDSQTASFILAATTASSSGNARPNMVLKTLLPTTITWSPIANLYTDATATTAYQANANASHVYFKSSSAAATVTYTATALTSLGCVRTSTVDVTVNALPTIVAVTPAAVCLGSTVDLTASAVTTGSDAGLTFTYFTDAAATTVLVNPNAVVTSGTYYIKGTNTNGCSVITPVTVTVNPLPVLTITTPVTICSPNTVDLTAASVTAGSDTGLTLTYWTDSAATIALTTASAVTTSGTYYIKAVNANGCEKIMPVTVTINVTNAPTGTASQAFCGSANLSQLVVTGSDIKWYNAATGGTEYPASLWTLVGLVNGTTYYASQTINGCESTIRFAVTAVVNPIPSAPNATAQTFCNAALVSDLLPNGSAYTWYDAATAGNVVLSTASVSTGTYYVSQTVNGCESARTAVAVTINTTTAPVASAQTFCNSALVVNLSATGTGLQWYSAVTGGSALSASTALATGTYYVSQTVNGCESTRTSVSVIVNSTTAPTATSQTFCTSGTVADLVATGSGLQWYSAATGGSALASTTVLTNGIYYVSQTVNGCESTRTAVNVTITSPATPVGLTTQTIFGGVGPDATIEDISVTGTNVIWYPTATDAAAGTNAIAAGTQLVDGATYYAVSVVGSCRSNALAVTVVVVLENQSFDIKSLKYYPNPVIDILTISYNSAITSVQVYDISGRQIRNMNPNSNLVTVDLSDLATSVYVVKVFANDTSSEFKVIKK